MKDINRILIETTIRKTIKEIKDSPKRSIRNLVDFALNFSKGRFQKPFLEGLQNMLKNETSPYYDLVLDTVYNVDTDRLVTFGMNLGYNGCTKGAALIREKEFEEKFNIPWSVSFEIDGDNFLDNEDKYLSVIKQGKELGIYTYLIFADGNAKSVLSIAKKHPDCAFVFFCGDSIIDRGTLDEADELYNIMFAVLYREDISETVNMLRTRQMLYSVFIPYTDANADEITNIDYYEGIEDFHPVFTALLPSLDCSKATRLSVYNFVSDIRKNQKLKTVLWDIHSDGEFVDGIISDDSCTAVFDKYGKFIFTNDNLSIFDMSMIDIFKEVFPIK